MSLGVGWPSASWHSACQVCTIAEQFIKVNFKPQVCTFQGVVVSCFEAVSSFWHRLHSACWGWTRVSESVNWCKDHTLGVVKLLDVCTGQDFKILPVPPWGAFDPALEFAFMCVIHIWMKPTFSIIVAWNMADLFTIFLDCSVINTYFF